MEVLLALAIIGGILGWALPYYFQVQAKAKQVELRLRLAAVASALERYYSYYHAFPEFLDPQEPILVEAHFKELVAMLSAETIEAAPLSQAQAAALNPHRHCFLRLNPQDYNVGKTSLRQPEGTTSPIYLKVCQDGSPLPLPHPLEGHTTPHRAIAYTYSHGTLIGSWTVVD